MLTLHAPLLSVHRKNRRRFATWPIVFKYAEVSFGYRLFTRFIRLLATLKYRLPDPLRYFRVLAHFAFNLQAWY